MNSFYSQNELEAIGFRKLGENVLLSRKASIYSPERIAIGDNVRIDDFCVLSGSITLGNYIHISAFCGLFAGSTGIEMRDFSGVSSRCMVYAESDDFSGAAMTNPMVPDEFRNVKRGGVYLDRHVLIGTGSTVLPGVTVGEGTSVGCMSLVNKSLPAWGVYAGVPCKFIKERKTDLLRLEAEFLARLNK